MDQDSWDEIDKMIVMRRVLPAMQAIRKLTGSSLSQAVELLGSLRLAA
ncbi:hypothetical protein WEI85_43190 [Actinomycetes bacterium KLBMP 9797]